VRTLGFDQLVAANKGGVTPEVQAMLKTVASDCSSKVGG
jgi:hypothetical protein